MVEYIRIFGEDDDTAKPRDFAKSTNSIVLYRRRWFILALFITTYILSNIQWIEYTAISDIVVKYYSVSNNAVNWTSLIFVIIYIPLAIPGSYLLQKYGLRTCMLATMGLTCVGSWIKVFSVPQDNFWIVMMGQFVSAIPAIYVTQAPPIVAALWFGAKEVSTACSLGIFGGLVGIAIGSFLPSIAVPHNYSNVEIGNNLNLLLLVIAIIGTVVFILQLMYQPPSPPSDSQVNKIEMMDGLTDYMKSCLTLMTNGSYICLVIAFAIYFSVPNTFFICLNQQISGYYEKASVETGRIGPIVLLAGICGVALNGFLLDKFHYYRAQFLIVQCCAIIIALIFTYTLGHAIYAVYVVSAFLGFFWIPTLPICIEVILELTHPQSEGLTIGFAYVFGHLVTIIFTTTYSYVTENVNELIANYLLCFSLFIALLFVIFIKFDYRRYASNFSQ